jgi:hypothetical protein
MFSTISRYRALPDAVTVDAAGRQLTSRALRIAGPVSGQFLHTVVEGDRLDGLAAAYYRQPRNWWRICDANPEFLSPQELVGAEPVVTYRFEVSPPPGTPPWADLLRVLGERVGVSRAVLDGDAAVLVTFNRLNLTTADLSGDMAVRGFVASRVQPAGRLGKTVVIPPDKSGQQAT